MFLTDNLRSPALDLLPTLSNTSQPQVTWPSAEMDLSEVTCMAHRGIVASFLVLCLFHDI